MEILLVILFLTIAFVVIVTLAQRSEPISIGSSAPALTLADANGTMHDVLAQAKQGRGAIVAFLPRDSTSRCFTEFAEFAERDAAFTRAGYRVYFVAVATPASNAAYMAQHKLSARLLADPKGACARAYGSIIDFVVYRFAKRTTYVIDAAGKIIDVQIVVEPKGHAQAVLNFVEASPHVSQVML